MKVLLYYPEWGNRWIPYVEQELSGYDLVVFNAPADNKYDINDLRVASSGADVLISMWCDGVTALWTHEFPEKKIISYMRRYEMHDTRIHNAVAWDKIDHLVFVSEYWERSFRSRIKGNPKNTCVIPNGIDVSGFPLRKEAPDNKKIAMVCSIKAVKNLPLAVQILTLLPEHEINLIGLPFNDQIAGQIFSYVDNLGLIDRFKYQGTVDRDEVSEWLKDKRFILSTSINEGNPNNIIEGMSMGIKPIIHNWPGALDQFPPWLVFNTVSEAVGMIKSDDYAPEKYREIIKEKYSIHNFKKLHELISG